MDHNTRLLCSVGVYSVEAWKRRTTNASARNPIPNNTSAADSMTFGDCANAENWTLPSLIAARAGRANIAEIAAAHEVTDSVLTQSLLAKIFSFKGSRQELRWPNPTHSHLDSTNSTKKGHVNNRKAWTRVFL